ncbi:HpcH/HpaI aldolase/citrate lyase family protein [Pseudaestuariivita atlantica]|uniref:Malyl-CoA thiolesterase n=1 Tax=Pseudaestuariivita atlantica TaxID=1317121 RepID=A0A0L1JSL3_9RHOB|nr:CoA ester lyase [Pseudaestuariivita atlantica]KNG94383.1 malyl-CoA thiolesterase [Pseudaestuariivita atlantica]
MPRDAHPYRSVLYLPASKERALAKARTLAADAIIFDLEDAVAPDAKDAARATLKAALDEGGFGARRRIVRINASDTPWHADDLAAAAEMQCDAVLLPKVGAPQDILDAAAALPGRAIWAMIETAAGVLNAAAIAGAHPALEGFVLGTNDLAKELGARPHPDRLPMMTALQTALLAARMGGLVVVDGVYNAFKDDDGLRRECEQGRDLGFDGKTLIHPAQLDITNAVFAPSADDISLAERQIAAFDEATAAGQGVAVVDGRIVENLHVEQARATLAKARAIEALVG